MSHFVRASKYRHVFAETPKPETCFTNIPTSSTLGEQNYIKGNTKYMAVGIQGGGGQFAILPYDTPKRFDRDSPVVSGHTKAVLDFDFSPFHEQIIASCSEDCTIKIWGIPEGGLTTKLKVPLVDLRGHARKVTLLRFHPTANNVLASVSSDTQIKLWDIEKSYEMSTFKDHSQIIQDIVWDHFGKMFATTSKDKFIRICDSRASIVAQSVPKAHEGARSTKLTYLGSKDLLVSVGFTRQSQRQMKLWDPRQLATEIKRIDIDQASGVLMPFYDEDTQILYLAGKGDGNIRYYEFVDENPWCFPISEYRSMTPAKGMAMVPKRGLNISKCETARLLKLTSNSVEPLSFVVPRKADSFQDDIYPPTFAGVPSLTADEWLSGIDKEPVTMDLSPGAKKPALPQPFKKSYEAFIGTGESTKAPFHTPASSIISDSDASIIAELDSELKAAHARIRLLEKIMKDSGMDVPHKS
mmetsp:Transcript_2364/g.3399  ORF Transcript_2364/g.3399 Transcript_2364/m.3399 type:complete len:469 (+) Transcript_2364:77-1483(+)|eukprot:CAMPEP_0171457824 /NCGR_PEP_ID=MMETSP0945-20130129/3744_1 /TAXON_ID=109269 /ORGANISM="Vaucheria litorea, Strain CCMP2940" /LENGTH=468 /DNA_ID=CAMNT_0011983501 /DNA_START=63 /DNA_END=1469 /DNA_ORIENTATION=-